MKMPDSVKTCVNKIDNRICTQCNNGLLREEHADMLGRCTTCVNQPTFRENRHLCLYCYRRPSTSHDDYSCDECREERAKRR